MDCGLDSDSQYVLQKVPLMTADDKDIEAELNQDTSKEEE